MRRCLVCLLLVPLVVIFMVGWLMYVQGLNNLQETANALQPLVAETAKEMARQ